MYQEVMSNVVNPMMIILAREYRELTQSELAARLHIGQGHLSKIENGLVEVTTKTLNEMIEILQYPKAFFMKRAEIYPPGLAFYRKYKSLPKKLQWKIGATANICRLHIESLLLSADIECKRVPYCDLAEYETPEHVAQSLREYWRIPYGPIKNLSIVAENAGALIKMTEFETRAFDGMSIPASDVYYILLINASMPWDRIRWTIAHELGHLVMHKLPTPDMEDEANRFAAEFLMPSSVIRHELTDISLPKLADLKPRWKVSMAALLRKARTLGMTTERHYRYLWMRMSRYGWKMREPVALDIPAEHPFLLQELFALHLDKLHYSLEELARILSMDPQEFLTVYRTQIPTTSSYKLQVLKGGKQEKTLA